MKFSFRIAAAAAAAVALSLPAMAAVTPYLSAANFNAALTGGSYTESFNGLTDPPADSYSDGNFGYTLAASSSLYTFGNEITTNGSDDAITITFTMAPVHGVGGNFFVTDFDGSFIGSQSLGIWLSSGESFVWTPASASSFVGFVSDVAFSWMTVKPVDGSAPNNQTGYFATIDNLTVGDVGHVPEPASLALVGLALASAAGLRRRKS